MIKPQMLRCGSRVAAISLAWGGAGTFRYRYEVGKRQLEEEFGVTVIETEHALRDLDWLCKNPKARADNLMAAFADDTIDGIFIYDRRRRFYPHPSIFGFGHHSG